MENWKEVQELKENLEKGKVVEELGMEGGA